MQIYIFYTGCIIQLTFGIDCNPFWAQIVLYVSVCISFFTVLPAKLCLSINNYRALIRHCMKIKVRINVDFNPVLYLLDIDVKQRFLNAELKVENSMLLIGKKKLILSLLTPTFVMCFKKLKSYLGLLKLLHQVHGREENIY